MLALLFTSLIAVCLDSSERRLTPREEQFISGIECLRADLKADCLKVTDTDDNSRCEWKDYACSALSRELSPAEELNPAHEMNPADELIPAFGCYCVNEFGGIPDCMAIGDLCGDAMCADPSDCMVIGAEPPIDANLQSASLGFANYVLCAGDCMVINENARPIDANLPSANYGNYDNGNYEISPADENAIDTVGCCRGFSLKTQIECKDFEDQMGCENEYCDWVETDDPSDCLLIDPIRPTRANYDDSDSADNHSTTSSVPITTTSTSILTTEEEMGCCRGNTIIDDDKCHENTAPALCTKHDNCQWLPYLAGSERDLCAPLPTTTSTPDDEETSTTEAFAQSTELMTSESTTESAASTTEDDDADADDGCCKGDAPDTNENCNEHIEATLCAKDGMCEWMVGNGTDDTDLCEFEFPTPVTGCCFGADVKTQSMCAEYDDEVSCERRCLWLATDDPSDCVLTSTASPTTTEEKGCCGGDTELKNSMCDLKDSRETCERSGNCAWNSGADADCAWTTEEPEPGCCASTTEHMADRCARLTTDESCEANKHCEFKAEWTDCSWPLPIEATTTTTKYGALDRSEMSLADDVDAKHRRGRRDESMLLDRVQGSVVYRSLDYALPLSTVLIFAIVTFVVFAVYRWLRSCREYTKISDPRETDARTHITCEIQRLPDHRFDA